MGLTAQQIADFLKPGNSQSYHETGSSAEELAAEYKARTASYNRALSKLKSAWTGDSSDSASTSLTALQDAGTVSGTNLHDVAMQMDTQGDSFTSVKNEVGDGPGPQPESTFASDHFPIFTDQDEKIDAWNERAQRVVEAYETYANGTNENAGVFPSTYGELSGDPSGLNFEVKSSGGGGTGVDSPNVGGGGGTSASGYTGGGGGGGAAAGGFAGGGGSGVGGGSTSPSAGGLTPGGSAGVGSGLPPGAVRLPDGSIRYPDGSIRTPDGRLIPPGGTRASSRGFGPGGSRDSSFGPGGAGAAAAAGMMGGMMGGAAGGGDAAAPRGGFGPGGGASSGATPGGGMGAKAVPGGMGAGMGRGGMGMGGMMGGAGAGGRGGKGEDEGEHKDEYYIKQEMDPGLKTEIDEYGEKLVDESTGMTVVPPVIGE